MTDPTTSDLRRTFEPVQPAWTPQRAEDAHRAVRHRLRQRTKNRRFMVAAASLLLVMGGGAWAWQRWTAPPAVVDESLRLEDGTIIQPLGVMSEVTVAERTPERRVVKLLRGGARFDVRPQNGRVFRVEAGTVVVEVLGTAFRIERVADRAHVLVQRGRVRVSWPAGSAELDAGQEGMFPPLPIPETTASPPTTRTPPPLSTRAVARPAWRTLAQRGRFDDAYRALSREGRGAVPDEPGALLLAADVARLSRHPSDAVAPLQSVLTRHPRDPRAGLAAFTLGIVFLQELGRPREAAEAFARSRTLEPRGDLSEDALARQVEALYRAGDRDAAAERARAYQQAYPQGRRLKAVKRFGGVP